MIGLILASSVLMALVYIRWFYVDYASIKGIPEAPGGRLLEGHFYSLGDEVAKTAEDYSQKFGWPVFQFRMGYRRAIMINSFKAAQEWMIKNQSATSDRPWLHTFHGVVSATSAWTIGSSPWNERTKKQRRVVGSLTTAPAIKRLQNVLDMETASVVSKYYYDGMKGAAKIQPHQYLERLSLNIMMMFCYATRFSSVEDPMLHQIVSDATTIASFRASKNNPQDFIPHLRYLPGNSRTSTAKEVRTRRDKWLATMLSKTQDRIEKSESPKKCVAEMLLTDNEAGLTTIDVKTILGGLMSGGFETLYSTAIIAIGVLASKEGQQMQEEAHRDILSHYTSAEEAFVLGPTEEKSQYVMGLVKEALRFYPPLKLIPLRQTYKDFVVDGSAVPKGVLVYMNAQAINRDEDVYGPDAHVFRPSRWMDQENSIPPPYHFAYGAGARMCTAVNFSNRVLYALFLRLIVSFKMSESPESPPNTDYIDYKRDPFEANAIPSAFKVGFEPRDRAALENWLESANERLTEFTTGEDAESLFR